MREDEFVALPSVKALRACVLDDERHALIDGDYRVVLLELRRDIDRILAVDPESLCGRCAGPLLGGEVGWHAVCP